LQNFGSIISHDLRGPLRAMRAFSDVLLEDYADSLPPAARQHLTRIRDSGQRMSELIDHVLAFSRLSGQSLRRIPLDFARLWNEVVEAFADQRSQRNIELRLHPAARATGDPILLRQVLENLFGNALKYSRGREPAIIEIGAVERDGEVQHFVRDNGVGFDPEHATNLFGMFQRLHGPEQFEGNGVGLAFAKRIIERHGGRIWAESSPGAGATFYFTLEERAGAGAT
jgi:signal transduction histidine kinase